MLKKMDLSVFDSNDLLGSIKIASTWKIEIICIDILSKSVNGIIVKEQPNHGIVWDFVHILVGKGIIFFISFAK